MKKKTRILKERRRNGKLGFKKIDNFGLHTPCTKGFTIHTPISRLKAREILTEKYLFIH